MTADTRRRFSAPLGFRSGVVGSVFEREEKRERQEGGTARGAAVLLTDSVEASLCFSKGGCLSFVETETAGYRSQMQSSHH